MGGFTGQGRFLCSELVETCRADPGGREYRQTVNLGEIWPAGAVLEFEEAVPMGTVVGFSIQGHDYWGRVMCCRPDVLGHMVEISFAPGWRWTRAQCEPDHLFAPLSLLADPPESRLAAVFDDCA